MLERFKYPIFIGLMLAITAGVVALLGYRPPPVTIRISPPLPTSTAGPLRVYVTGAVQNPAQSHTLPPGSRVEDAIRAAGGLTSAAQPESINMARRLVDGEHVHVPAQGENAQAPEQSEQPTGSASAAPIHINTASAQELEALPGVGPVLAGQIVAYRAEHGPFRSLADLDAVPGVGPARLAQWAPLIVFD